eukprot:Hpha_TRINITY_DN16107_c1_g4::TRINITY_DN16107_c1_g4_i1::g.4000::m.4000
MANPMGLKVGIQFVKEYYGKMSRQPEALANMYARDSAMTNITGSDGSPVRSVGVDEIKEKLASWTKETAERKFTISSIESQACHADGFFIHVKGVLLTRSETRQFTHTFVLGKSQNKGDEQARYYISIDFLEVGDNTRDDAWAAQPETQEQQVSPARTPKQQPETFIQSALEPTTDDVPPVPEAPVPVAAPVAPAVVAAPIEEEQPEPQEEVQEEVQEESPVEPEEEEAPIEEEPVPAEPVVEEQVEEPVAEPVAPVEEPVAQEEPEVELEEPVTVDEDAGAVASSWVGVLKGGSRGQPAQVKSMRVVGGRIPQAARYEEQRAQQKEETTRPARRGPPADRPAADAKPAKSPRRAAGGAGGLDSRYKYPALYVSKIPAAMTEQEIDDLFSKYGKVVSKTLKREQHCCFIDFADRSAIEKALAEPQFVGEVRLHVQERMSPEERAKQRDRQDAKRTTGGTAPRRQGDRPRQGN